MFARNRDALAEQFRVITIDHRGYGRSIAPGAPIDLSVHAQDALAVLAALDVGPVASRR